MSNLEYTVFGFVAGSLFTWATGVFAIWLYKSEVKK